MKLSVSFLVLAIALSSIDAAPVPSRDAIVRRDPHYGSLAVPSFGKVFSEIGSNMGNQALDLFSTGKNTVSDYGGRLVSGVTNSSPGLAAQKYGSSFKNRFWSKGNDVQSSKTFDDALDSKFKQLHPPPLTKTAKGTGETTTSPPRKPLAKNKFREEVTRNEERARSAPPVKLVSSPTYVPRTPNTLPRMNLEGKTREARRIVNQNMKQRQRQRQAGDLLGEQRTGVAPSDRRLKQSEVEAELAKLNPGAAAAA